MLSKKMQEAINVQINKELNSAYVYLGMVSYFEAEDFNGMAHWMTKQAGEEIEHAMKLFGYVNERGGKVTLPALEKVSVDYKNPLDVFQAGLEHEKSITKSIHELYELALAEKDYATQEMLHWFIEEQVEEESNFSHIVALLEKIGEQNGGLMILDGQLGKRD